MELLYSVEFHACVHVFSHIQVYAQSFLIVLSGVPVFIQCSNVLLYCFVILIKLWNAWEVYGTFKQISDQK
jgi:hypothetical protein